MTTFRLKALALAAAAPLMALAAPVAAQQQDVAISSPTAIYASITVAEVEAAQRAWGDALVAISAEYQRNGHAGAKALAERVLDSAYAYDLGPVLFKPTLTLAPQTFRTTRAGALAYFVGGDSNFPNDSGFALRGWQRVEIENAGIVISGNTATSMGNVHFFDANGNRTTVDKTWGYVRGPDGSLRIVLHHSSLPYSG